MQIITPFLWFNANAEEAVHFYTSIFENSKVGGITRYPEGGMMPAGMVMTITFEIEGQEFIALNGGPVYQFSPAISFVVNCQTQAELDGYWDKLQVGGGEVQCGWLKDKFGVSWQIVPVCLFEMLQCGDPAKAQRVTHAMLKMVKLDIAELKRAFESD